MRDCLVFTLLTYDDVRDAAANRSMRTALWLIAVAKRMLDHIVGLCCCQACTQDLQTFYGEDVQTLYVVGLAMACTSNSTNTMKTTKTISTTHQTTQTTNIINNSNSTNTNNSTNTFNTTNTTNTAKTTSTTRTTNTTKGLCTAAICSLDPHASTGVGRPLWTLRPSFPQTVDNDKPHPNVGETLCFSVSVGSDTGRQDAICAGAAWGARL